MMSEAETGARIRHHINEAWVVLMGKKKVDYGMMNHHVEHHKQIAGAIARDALVSKIGPERLQEWKDAGMDALSAREDIGRTADIEQELIEDDCPMTGAQRREWREDLRKARDEYETKKEHLRNLRLGVEGAFAGYGVDIVGWGLGFMLKVAEVKLEETEVKIRVLANEFCGNPKEEDLDPLVSESNRRKVELDVLKEIADEREEYYFFPNFRPQYDED
ncbi:hypothetical protein AAC691_10310 [Nguyenibacter vanlangensis]|uniref:Uncharacterized protein n=1 Tax=Nguyenibacter vanlangensis TaxID=1216886 RepID=A0ABZ3DBB1_9PROT